MNFPTTRWITLLAVLLLLLGSGEVWHVAAHEQRDAPHPGGSAGEITAPLLPVAYPVKRPIDPGISMHKQVEDALRLTMEYRRLIEYFLVVAETPDLLSYRIPGERMTKILQLLADFESYALQVNIRLAASEQAGHPDLPGDLRKRLLALRKELDHHVLKHYKHLGIPLIRISETGLDCDMQTIRLQALAGHQSTGFILLGETQEPGRWEIQVQQAAVESKEGDGQISIYTTTGGIVPLSFDRVVDESESSLVLLASYRPDDADGSVMSKSVPMNIEVIQPALVEIECIDAETGDPLACRMQLKDRHGIVHVPLGARTTEIPSVWGGGEDWNSNYRYSGEKFFYGKGRLRITLPPGPVVFRALHGFEYDVFEKEYDLPPGETVRIQVPMARWIDMHARGWRCGQTHVHSLNLMPVNDFSGWEIVSEAEGLDISYLLTLQQHGVISSDQYPIGPLPHLSHSGCLHSVGEEFRHFSRGHVTFHGLLEMVEPISTGILRGDGQPESPSNAEAIREAHNQGALAAYAHLDSMGGFISSEELPIDAALGLVDAGEVMGGGGGYTYWYALLNCGIRIGATAGPDWDLEDCCRVYVNMGGTDFTEGNWLEELRNHHTFVTTGPMLFLTVNGQGPGSVVSNGEAQTLKINSQALSAYPLEKLELIVNGRVVATEEPQADGKAIQLETTYRPESNGWIAARCFGEGNAHTSAVYIELDDQPVQAVEDAKLLRGFAMKALQRAEKSRYYPTPAAKQKVLAIFREGTAFYDKIIERGPPETHPKQE